MPKYGLALDNLRSAEMVMADGSVARASADENPDLFWAIRGGGGNFGIAASLRVCAASGGAGDRGRAGGVPTGESARSLASFFREQCASAPDELMLMAGLSPRPRRIGDEDRRHGGRTLLARFPRARPRSGRSRHSGRRSWIRWVRSPTARRTPCSTRLYPEARSTTGSPSFSPA